MIMGNLTEDPALRFTQGGTAVLNMRVAASERYQDKDKEWKDRTEYVNIVVWGKRAEGLGKILQKGAGVLCQGRLRTSSYDAPDGTKRYKTEVHCDEVRLTGGRGRSEGAQESAAPPQRGNGVGGGGGSRGSGNRSGMSGGHGYTGNPDNFADDGDIPFLSPAISHDLRRYGL
jgi:single-strand DNA-binding protein